MPNDEIKLTKNKPKRRGRSVEEEDMMMLRGMRGFGSGSLQRELDAEELRKKKEDVKKR